MKQPFKSGARVRIAPTYHWAQSALATVREPPDYILELADGWKGDVREVPSLKGLLLFQWVEFDVPQQDADGDGPYAGGEIELDHLEAAV
jgi:hypothetical protein